MEKPLTPEQAQKMLERIGKAMRSPFYENAQKWLEERVLKNIQKQTKK